MNDIQPTTQFRIVDALERLLWTFVAGFLSSLLGVPIIVEMLEGASDVSIELGVLTTMLYGAVIAGLTAVANAVLIIARWRLSVLPDPGRGLPGGTPLARSAGPVDIGSAIVGTVVATLLTALAALLLLLIWP